MAQVNAAQAVKEALTQSELLAELRAVSPAEGQARPLRPTEIKALEALGNAAEDWDKVKVGDPFRPHRIVGNYFRGTVVLGSFAAELEYEGLVLGSGVYHSMIADSVIESDALVRRVGLLAGYVVRSGAVVSGCGTVAVRGETSFGNGVELPIAIETGGREVLSFAELSVAVAEAVAGNRGDKPALAAYEAAVKEYVAAVKTKRGVISRGAVLAHTPKIVDTFVGPYAVIDGAAWVENCTLLSNKEEKTKVLSGAYLKHAILQWGAEAATGAIVQNSVCLEHSHVERHGKLTDSILGPNSGVAEGECTASLCGPFVGFHHQALLIAAYWPEGKGNVGYGANVGSNHTSKAPDQELWAGEGTFFGLGVNVKYPADFTRAPYSILASGVSCLPQRLEMPFSLINVPSRLYEGLSPAYNEIMPGWVLSDNIFTVRRNEGKYQKRNKARRQKFDFRAFRPETVALMLEARSRLQTVSGKEVYTDADIKGLGKNYMTESSRQKGIEAYTFYLRYYALTGLKDQLSAGADPQEALTRPAEGEWEFQRQLISKELPGKSVRELLSLLVQMQKKSAADTQLSKEKDDKRGARIIADYPQAHPPAAEDSFVRETYQVATRLEKEVNELLARL